MCSSFLFFFSLNIDSLFFSSWCNQIIIIIFLSFSNFFDSDGFFYWWTVYQTRVQTINVRWPLFKVIWKKNICSFKSQRGNKGSHFVFYDKETWPHIISKTWLFFFQEILTQEKKMVHVTVCPLLFFFFLFSFFFA